MTGDYDRRTYKNYIVTPYGTFLKPGLQPCLNRRLAEVTEDAMSQSERFLHRRRLARPYRDAPVLRQLMDETEQANASSEQN